MAFALAASVMATAAPKWKAEVGIGSWCYNLDVMKHIVKAENDGNPELGNALATKAFQNRTCVRLPIPAAAFRPKAEVEKYADFGGEPVTILKGNLIQKDESLGREVYILVPDKLLPTFQMADGAKFPIEGPEYGGGTAKLPSGWQDL